MRTFSCLPFRDSIGWREGEGYFRRVSDLRGVERQLRAGQG